MLFAIYTLLAFIAFRAVSSSKHVVDMSMEENTRDIWGRRQALKKGGASSLLTLTLALTPTLANLSLPCP